MAHSSPHPLVYAPAPGHSDAAEYYQQYAADGVYQPSASPYYYHSHQRESVAGPYPDEQDAGAVVVSNQEPTSHQYYGDASAAVIQYPIAYPGEPGDAWVQAKPAHGHNFYLSGPQQEAICYDSGGASPASDDSSPAFYDSPVSSEASNLADDYKCYYGRSAPTPPAEEEYVRQSAYVARRENIQDVAAYQPAATQFSGASHSRYDYSQNYPAAYYPEPSPTEERHSAGEMYSECGEYSSLPSPTCYADSYQRPQVAVAPARTESPMDHLPYPETNAQSRNGSRLVPSAVYSSASSSSYTHLPQLPLSMSLHHPQPLYSSLVSSAHPSPIAIPSRSPLLLEDTPKKPLTLACFFCRKRKIACGSPPQGATDRTCNQCARRKLQCVYPVGTRRSARQRELDATAADGQPLRVNA